MYSLIERTPERELLPMIRTLNIGITHWSPFGGECFRENIMMEVRKNETKKFETNNPMTAAFVNERNHNSEGSTENSQGNK